MIYSTVYSTDGDGIATAVWRAETSAYVASDYVQVLFGPDSDPHGTYLTVDTAVPAEGPGLWDGPDSRCGHIHAAGSSSGRGIMSGFPLRGGVSHRRRPASVAG